MNVWIALSFAVWMNTIAVVAVTSLDMRPHIFHLSWF